MVRIFFLVLNSIFWWVISLVSCIVCIGMLLMLVLCVFGRLVLVVLGLGGKFFWVLVISFVVCVVVFDGVLVLCG